jgi:hypothetical protein
MEAFIAMSMILNLIFLAILLTPSKAPSDREQVKKDWKVYFLDTAIIVWIVSVFRP